MAGRYGKRNWSALTKRGIAVSLGAFLLAVAVEVGAALAGVSLPGWEETLLVEIEAFGVLGLLVSVFVIGIFLPLTE
ncbi:hypothetical protein [Halobaculum sp. D14]|uniref:DUF7860 family protein n=1 Tax=unclassified Halobaculum TaxID=2640896 RepID=UPI003EBE52F8